MRSRKDRYVRVIKLAADADTFLEFHAWSNTDGQLILHSQYANICSAILKCALPVSTWSAHLLWLNVWPRKLQGNFQLVHAQGRAFLLLLSFRKICIKCVVACCSG